MKILLIDNYDSFTFNLYQFIGEILQSHRQGETGGNDDILVRRNDQISLADARDYQPDRIIISPGPGSPDDPSYFGICAELISTMGKSVPLFGVCLGMQGIAHCFGGQVIPARLPMHGKTSLICHDNSGLFSGLPTELEVMRYHSLVVNPENLPQCLHVNATTLADSTQPAAEIMGIRHREYPISGVQFHPESFATEGGKELLNNFLVQG